MKKIIIIALLFPLLCSAQSAVMHFYYGSNEMLGAEYHFLLKGKENTYLGGGFSGATNKNKAIGEWRTGKIQESEKALQYSTTKEQWCSLYATASFGYIGPVLISYKAGLAIYDEKANFKGDNPVDRTEWLYNKNYKVLYRPLIGASAQYQITKDYGLCGGWDSFNGFTVGVSVVFE